MLRILVLGTALVGCGPPKMAPAPTKVDTRPPAGGIAGTVTLADAFAVHLLGRAVPLAELPMVDLIGLPMDGTADFAIDVEVPIAKGVRDYSRARGVASFLCLACRLGKEGTKILEGHPLAKGGLAIGHVELGRLEVGADVRDGRVRLTAWKLASEELVLDVGLELELRPALADAVVTGCLRYKVLPPLQKRDPKITALIDLVGGQVGADGMASIVMSGKLSNVRLAAGACTTKR